MKRTLALLLCLILLLALPVGCKKDKQATNPAGELTNSQISIDLKNSTHLYYYAHTGSILAVSGLKVSDKEKDGNAMTLKATATAQSNHVSVDLAADMRYVVINNKWTLDTVEITKAVPTILAGPEKESVLMEISNYLAHNATSQEQNKSLALAYLGEERHSLEITVSAVTWGVDYKEGSDTAKLTAKLTSDALTFSGYYTLTFDKKVGWVIETEKQDNGQHYPVLHLDTLEQKAAEKK